MPTKTKVRTIIGFMVEGKHFDTLDEAKGELRHLLCKNFKKDMKEVDNYKLDGLRDLCITMSIKVIPIYEEDKNETIKDKFEEEILKKGLTDGELENLNEDEILALYLKNNG